MQEFLFRKDALQAILDAPGSSIAIRIRYESTGTGNNEFRAIVEAVSVNPNPGQESTSTTQSPTVRGCPNPPGCD